MKMKLHKLHFKNYSVKFERYTERQGGYTRILKVGPRRGDGLNQLSSN